MPGVCLHFGQKGKQLSASLSCWLNGWLKTKNGGRSACEQLTHCVPITPTKQWMRMRRGGWARKVARDAEKNLSQTVPASPRWNCGLPGHQCMKRMNSTCQTSSCKTATVLWILKLQCSKCKLWPYSQQTKCNNRKTRTLDKLWPSWPSSYETYEFNLPDLVM